LGKASKTSSLNAAQEVRQKRRLPTFFAEIDFRHGSRFRQIIAQSVVRSWTNGWDNRRVPHATGEDGPISQLIERIAERELGSAGITASSEGTLGDRTEKSTRRDSSFIRRLGPLNADTYGGSFLYHMKTDSCRWASSSDSLTQPYLDPYEDSSVKDPRTSASSSKAASASPTARAP